MNWGSLVSSILPTIGTVVGSLLGTNKIEDGVIYYSYQNVKGADKDFSSVFYKEGQDYYLFNQSTKAADQVTISFPRKETAGAETIIVPGHQSFRITPLFEENAQNDNSVFELSASSQETVTIDGAEKSYVKICSSGMDIPVNGQKQQIGTYLDAYIEPQQITITPRNNVQLQSLPLLTVQASGDTQMRILEASGDKDEIVVPLPQPLIKDDIISLDVIANVEQNNSMLEEQMSSGLMNPLDASTIERLRSAPRLNWR